MRLEIRFCLLLCCLIGGISRNYAQLAPDSDWLGLTVPIDLGSKWQLSPEIGYRTYTPTYIRFQNLLRFTIRHRFNELNNLASGLAFFTTKLSLDEQEKSYGKEFRLFQEGNHTIPITHKFNFNQRLRFEQRFYQATPQYTAYHGLRLRLLLNGQYRFHPKWFLNLSSEYMESFEKQTLKMDQWRMISFLSFLPIDGLQLNFGYTYIIRPAYRQNVFILTFFKSFGVNESRQHSS
ncbi:MAG: DUF2490 domain-containing protein [Saprospiraceae bacterium]|nr:DUF2490 domain-containing protein [Saprospiraceae bacterium]